MRVVGLKCSKLLCKVQAIGVSWKDRNPLGPAISGSLVLASVRRFTEIAGWVAAGVEL